VACQPEEVLCLMKLAANFNGAMRVRGRSLLYEKSERKRDGIMSDFDSAL